MSELKKSFEEWLGSSTSVCSGDITIQNREALDTRDLKVTLIYDTTKTFKVGKKPPMRDQLFLIALYVDNWHFQINAYFALPLYV